MLVKQLPIATKGVKYPVFAKYKATDEVYMFTSKNVALIITHQEPNMIMTFAQGVLGVTDPAWEILPDGYTIQLTQDQS